MARMAASSRSLARRTRSSSFSFSAAVLCDWVTAISGILCADTLDASARERFRSNGSKQDSLPIVLLDAPSGLVRRNARNLHTLEHRRPGGFAMGFLETSEWRWRHGRHASVGGAH